MAFKQKIYTTPVGELIWPKLNEPDSYKGGDLNFNTKLALDANSEECQKFIAFFEAYVDQGAAAEAVQEAQEWRKEKPVPAKKLQGNWRMPFTEETDANGEETGRILFGAFKMKEERKFTKNGITKIIKQSPKLMDSSGSKVTEAIWGGSTAKVAFTLNPYYTGALGAGLSTPLKAVQILALVGPGGAESAEDFGFNTDGGGFQSEGTLGAPDGDDGDAGEAPAGAPTSPGDVPF
jgi:hypothetical protein